MKTNTYAIYLPALAGGLIAAAATPAVNGQAVVVPEDAPTIQQAIALALEQGAAEVLVLPGVYAERVEFLGGPLTVRSADGAATTTIDATGLGGAAVIIDGVDGAVLEGFTVTGGDESGVRITESTAEVRDSVITGNSAGMGGGLYALNSTLGLTGVSFTDNAAGYGGAASFVHSTISGGGVSAEGNTATAFGGGLYTNLATLDLNGVDVSGNGTAEPQQDGIGNATIFFTFGGGGAYFKDSNGLVANARFNDNAGAFGGGIYVAGGGSLEIANVLVSGNQTIAGAVYANSSSPVLTNASIIDNNDEAQGDFGVFTTFNAEPIVRNSVLSGNGGTETAGNGETTLTNSIVNGAIFSAVVDDTVLEVDPGLDADGRPLPGSPVIDAGVNADVPAGVTTDLGGDPRFVDDPNTPDSGQGEPPIVDLGAFEFQVGEPALACMADMNGSGVVDSADLSVLLAFFGEGVPPMSRGDMDGDGFVDSTDLSTMLGVFGVACD